MKAISKSEAAEWLPSHGMKFNENGKPGFAQGKNLTVRMPLPDKPYHVARIAHFLLTGFDDEPFSGGLLWLTDWDIWSDDTEQAGYKMFELMRQSLGESRELMEAPAHLFRPEEKVEAQSFLILPILFGWDAYFIPTSGRHFAFTSHDEFIDVVSSDDEMHANWLSALEKNWGGKEIRQFK